jgi:hypothetical protein
MSKSTKYFVCRFHDFHIEIIKQIRATNEQYKFQADLYKFHDAFNIKDFFMLNLNGVYSWN